MTIRRPGEPDVRIRWSDRTHGDFHPGRVRPDRLERRRRSVVDLPWTMLDQTHGIVARFVERPGEHDGVSGDVLATGLTGVVLGCWAADCAPVVLVGEHGRIAMAHAGWRGLAAGVLDEALDACGVPIAHVVLGPVIGPCCYEFETDDLDAVAHRLLRPMPEITGRTRWGTPSLDVPEIVAGFAFRHDAEFTRVGGCTGCEFAGFSHRVRGDTQRHVVGAWQEAS